VLYLIIGRSVNATVYGVSFHAFYMVDMAMLGAFSGALNGNAIRISQEKKDGWIRQLRLTSLPAYAYVVSKILVSMATTVTSIVIVFALGRYFGNVHLAAWQWPVIGVTVWFSATIFAALAVAIGYRYLPDQVQPVTMMAYLGFAILGGIWYPFSGTMQKVSELTPTYQGVKIGADIIEGVSVSPGYVIGLAAWLAVFVALATLAVRSTAETL
jgi:ABC-2 type transport system permease protein